MGIAETSGDTRRDQMAEEKEGLPEQVDVERARMAVARHAVTVVDVRPEEQFAEERIFGSVRVDPDNLEEELGERDEEEDLLIVCADGERSAEVAEQLRSDGRSASSLEGGFEAWTGENLPTAPGRDEEYEGPDVKIPGAVASSGEPDEDEDEEEGGDEDEDEEESSAGAKDG
jgi:rhodanese-related sulfurtransferase